MAVNGYICGSIFLEGFLGNTGLGAAGGSPALYLTYIAQFYNLIQKPEFQALNCQFSTVPFSVLKMRKYHRFCFEGHPRSSCTFYQMTD